MRACQRLQLRLALRRHSHRAPPHHRRLLEPHHGTESSIASVGQSPETCLVSAVADPKSDKLVTSCKRITAELRRLESHRVDLPLVGSSDKERPESSFRPKDGE